MFFLLVITQVVTVTGRKLRMTRKVDTASRPNAVLR